MRLSINSWGESNGKYTITNSDSNRSGGWSAEGNTEYRRLWHAVKKGRKHKDTLAKETAVYDHLRSLHHITAMTAEEHPLRSRCAVGHYSLKCQGTLKLRLYQICF